MKKAVHIGAGNIGRAFIGPLLLESGYDLTFLDVSEPLTLALEKAPQYILKVLTLDGSSDETISGYHVINSKNAPEQAAQAIACADILTTSVGPAILKFIAPLLTQALTLRNAPSPLLVMACENAFRASSALKGLVQEEVREKAAFVDTAVDRIVPAPSSSSLDVVTERSFEWCADTNQWSGADPELAGITWTTALEAHLWRKLCLLNGVHAYIAWMGMEAGDETICDAFHRSEIQGHARALSREVIGALSAKFDWSPEELKAYSESVLDRISAPYLSDPCSRVGRNPLQKISFGERLSYPLEIACQNSLPHSEMLRAVLKGYEQLPAEERKGSFSALLAEIWSSSPHLSEILKEVKLRTK